MKKLNWKCPTVKKMIVAACATGLLLFTMAAGTGLLNFDDLPNDTEGLVVPPGYGNLQWDNFYSLDGVHFPGTTGYTTGVVSKNNVIINGYGLPASIYANVKGGNFTPLTMYLTAAWTDKVQAQINGYLRGRLVLSRSYTLRTTKPTLIKLGVKVDELDFSTSDSSQLVMDNLLIKR
jgi:hypothetical protein